MGGSQKWVARVREFDGGRQVIEALARDRYGIAISGVQYATAQVKPLALGATDGGPFVFATRDSVMTHQYPLTRSVSMFFDHAPGHPIDPKVAAYLSYVLSADGQDAIARDGGYLPLSPEVAAHELETLR
jgi:phosphate transport system substrate-binding protein